jgi:hypothetical protein
VADSEGVNVRESTGELIEVKFDVEEWEGDFGFLMMTGDGVDCFGDVFED